MPAIDCRLLYLDHLAERGRDLEFARRRRSQPTFTLEQPQASVSVPS